MENFNVFMRTVFGGDTPEFPLTAGQVAARAATVYVIGIVFVRLGKGRLIGRITSLDVLLGFILGSLLSRGITGQAALSDTSVATAALVGLHWLLTAAACRWHEFGTLIKGYPRPVVEDGRVLEKALRQSHLSRHDLEEELRLHGVEDVSEVRRAYKERNGEVSVIRATPADGASRRGVARP